MNLVPSTKKTIFTKADRLLNDTTTAAKEAVVSAVLQNPKLALLNIGNTIIRRNFSSLQQVMILSGGESGHEPLYSGFIGEGFLTATIQGDVFMAPASFHIANVIREMSYETLFGVLIIIQNNPADSLNFGIAMEKVQSEGAKVMLLIVTDDCSDVAHSNKTDQPRGLTGVLLVQKIAAAMAEMNFSLSQIYNYCDEVQKRIKTVILTLKQCTSPSENICVCMKHGKIYSADIGGGLHGETGIANINLSSTKQVVEDLLNELKKHITLKDTTPYVLMINNLCVSKLEETIFIGEVLKRFMENRIKILRLYCGTFMTSLDMKGFTVTIMEATTKILTYLDHPTEAFAWNSTMVCLDVDDPLYINHRIHIPKNQKVPQKGPKLDVRESNVLLITLQFVCDALVSCERQLNIMDSEYGDGDTGTRLKIAADEILDLLKNRKVDLECIYTCFKRLSLSLEKIGGTLAAIYTIMFESAANFMQTLSDTEPVNAKLWLTCLFNVIHSLKSYSKTEDGSHNMLGPLMACAQETEEALNSGKKTGLEAFCVGVVAAEEAVKKTRLANRKYPDSGAHAVHIWMRAVYEAVKFKCEF